MSTRRLTLALSALSALSLAACDHDVPSQETSPAASSPSAPVVSARTMTGPAAKPPATTPDRLGAAEPSSQGPRIGALKQDTYIYAEPRMGSPEIGALDIGGTTLLAEEEPVGTSGCAGGWYAVQPRGYICHGQSTTLDPDNHPLIQAKRRHAGRFDAAAVYRWGESRYAPLYRRLPDRAEQRRWEGALDKHLGRLEKLREARRAGASEADVPTPFAFRGVDIFPSSAKLPAFLEAGAVSPWSAVHTPNDERARYEIIPARSTIAWSDEFFAEGRSWLLTPDLLLVPKDKVSVQEPSSFRGVRLGKDGHALPVAFIRVEPRTKYRLEGGAPASSERASSANDVVPAVWEAGADFAEDPDDGPGHFVATEETWKRLDTVALTGRAKWKRGKRYLETRDAGFWIREKDAVVIRGREPEGLELQEGEKWLDVSIYRGSLVAYEGRTPVFATLISPGLFGYKRVKGKPAKYTTPTGAFRIEWKHVTQTMSPDPEKKSYYLSEVPYTQFFHMPFALHGAYWHDRFGEPKSGGCVNLSVADAKWVFGWTEPQVPEGWHSIRSGDDRGQGTWVVVR